MKIIEKIEDTNSIELLPTKQKAYNSRVKSFKAWLVKHDKALSAESISEFLAGLRETHKSASVNNYKAALKKSLSLSVKSIAGQAQLDSFFKTIKTPSQDKKIAYENILCKEDREAIKNNLDECYALVFSALEQTGLRISELVNAKLTDCKRVKEAVAVRVIGKGQKERRVFITLKLYSALRDRAFRFGSSYLVCGNQGGRINDSNTRKAMSKAGALVGVRVNPHKLRHTFATEHVKARGSVKAVSLYLGHASTAITESMYVHDELTADEALQFVS